MNPHGRGTLMTGLLMVGLILAACGGDDGGSALTAPPGTVTVLASVTATPAGAAPVATSIEQQPNSSTPTAGSQQASGETADVRAVLEAGSSAEVRADDPDPNAAAMSIAELGRVRVTIVAIHEELETTSAIFQPEAGNRFWALEVTLEALDEERVNSGFWTLRTVDGTQYDWSYVPGFEPPSLNYDVIVPGEALTGLLVFEIPEDATVASVKMDPHIFVGGNLIFE